MMGKNQRLSEGGARLCGLVGFQRKIHLIESVRSDLSMLHRLLLTMIMSGDPFYPCKMELEQHSTESPPRYIDGSLIEKMEKLGIQRPSTYATTIKVLQISNIVAHRMSTIKNADTIVVIHQGNVVEKEFGRRASQRRRWGC